MSLLVRPLELVQSLVEDECLRIAGSVSERTYAAGRYAEAAALSGHVSLAREFVVILTLPGYEGLKAPTDRRSRRPQAA